MSQLVIGVSIQRKLLVRSNIAGKGSTARATSFSKRPLWGSAAWIGSATVTLHNALSTNSLAFSSGECRIGVWTISSLPRGSVGSAYAALICLGPIGSRVMFSLLYCLGFLDLTVSGSADAFLFPIPGPERDLD